MFCEFDNCRKIVASPKLVARLSYKIVCEFGPRTVNSYKRSDMGTLLPMLDDDLSVNE